MLELARESDWEAVKRLSVHIHDLHAVWRPDIYYHSEEPYLKEQFLADLVDRLVYVAKPQGQVLGYVILSILQKGGPGRVACKQLRLDVICVDSTARGQGIGRQMVADVRALARAFGCREVVLSVHPENDGAVAFYQKCGFFIRTIGMDMKI